MLEWSSLLLDVVKAGLGSAASAITPKVWKQRALARFNDSNPLRPKSVNHDLLRATRLAWVEAALAVTRSARSSSPDDGDLAKLADLAEKELRKVRSLAFDRDEDPAFSPIDTHVDAIMRGVAEYVAPHGTQAAAQAVTKDFAATFAAVIKWPLEELPPVFKSIAATGLKTNKGQPRAFGELVFAEFAEILKSPKRYPEAREAFYIATD